MIGIFSKGNVLFGLYTLKRNSTLDMFLYLITCLSCFINHWLLVKVILK